MSIELWSVPASWSWVKLIDVGQIFSGGTPSTKEPAYWGEEVTWFAPSDLTGYRDKYISKGAKSLSLLGLQRSSAKVMPAGSVMFSSRAPIGYVAINSVDAATNQGFKSLVPSEAIFNEYAYYYLKSSKQLAEQHATGTTFKEISGTAFGRLPIPLPPRAEQRRIVAKVEELFSGLDAAEQSLTTARLQLGLYRQALLKAAFEGRLTARWRAANKDKLESPAALLQRIRTERQAWHNAEQLQWEKDCHAWEKAGKVGPKPSRTARYVAPTAISDDELKSLPALPEEWAYLRLSEMAHVSSGMSVSRSRKYIDPVEVPYLRVANVQRGYLDLSEIKEMPVEKTRLPSLALRELDILFNEGGDRDKLGRGWVWENKITPCVTQNHVFRATLFKVSEARAKLLSHWGNSYGQDYFLEEGKQTTNLASINQTVLKALPVPLIPDEEAQFLFSSLEAAISTIDATEVEITTNLQKIITLRQAILKRAFSGRLVPQDPADEPAATLLARLRASTPAKGKARQKSTRKASA